MRSFIILTTIIIICSLLRPWWIIVIVSLLYMSFNAPNSLWKSIAISFLSGFISYLLFSIYSSLGLDRSPAELIANLFGELPSWSAYLITALIGGIAAAFGGVSGYLARNIWKNSLT
jgi:hypothetical protein